MRKNAYSLGEWINCSLITVEDYNYPRGGSVLGDSPRDTPLVLLFS